MSLAEAALGLLDPITASPADRGRYAAALLEWADRAEALGSHAQAARYRARAEVLALEWVCELHGLVSAGDCPLCDAEAVALTDDLFGEAS